MLEDYALSQMSYGQTGEPYTDQWELMQDLFTLLDYRIYLLYKYHQWLGPNNDMKNMLGLVVTREEFEHNLTRAAAASLDERAGLSERKQMHMGERAAALRMRATQSGAVPLMQLFERFGLDEFERDCVVLAYACELDEKYEKLLAYLQDDVTKKEPTIRFAVSMFLPERGRAEAYTACFSGESPFTSLFDREKRGDGILKLSRAVSEYLSGGVSFPSGYRLFNGTTDVPDGDLLIQREISAQLDAICASTEQCAVLLHGPAGSGRRFQIEHLCVRRGARCVFADAELLGHTAECVETAAMLARLTDAYLCFFHIDAVGADGVLEPPPALFTEALVKTELSQNKLFLLSVKQLHTDLGMPLLELELPAASADERLTLLRAYLAGVALAEDISLEELATKFHFTPRQLRNAAEQAANAARITDRGAISGAELHRMFYRQVTHKLDALATRVKPNYTWNDIVLPEEQKRLMQHACAHVRYQHRVYYEWGFDSKISYGRGVSILFAGAPGTGKTMCAQIMANQLNMEMFKINISQIVSKYIGETEKNLQAVFSEAKSSNCILFFDECDALFGKRSEVKDAHDRNANVETAYLLQQIEEYDGVCVLATNLVQNIDEAFMRRIAYVVHFPFPDAAMREEIYRRTIAAEAPLEEGIDFKFLAEKFELSGGYIKNIVLAAAFMAAGEGKAIGMRHFLNAAINEMKKNEIVVVREELREYADLIDS